MVVVDSSALIPLSRVARLDLVRSVFEEIRTTEDVEGEVLTEGKRGTSALRDFLDAVEIHEVPPDTEDVAALEGVSVTDASVILVAEDRGEALLANDKGLIEVARSHDVECWWVTTVLLKCTKEGVLTSEEATDVLYDLVDEGMNLHPQVYARVQQKLRDLGD